jgi:catechol 2,3-dioxygenase-like lactoylglutathione lyase family enzyme
MELEASYPVVVTDKLIECRDFYTRWFGFRVVFEATWFVYLKPSDESPHGIAFIAPDHPSQPPGPEAFDGEGILLTFQVHDASSEFDRVRRSGLLIEHPLREEPWGSAAIRAQGPRGRMGGRGGTDRSRAGLLGSIHLMPGGFASAFRSS